MNTNQLKQSVLFCYLKGQEYLHKKESDKYRELKISSILKKQDASIEDWQISFITEQLTSDGFIQGSSDLYFLTPSGILAAESGHYTRKEREEELQTELNKQTLLSLKRSKYAIIISVAAIIIPSIISLYSIWENRLLPSPDEWKKIQDKVLLLENKKTIMDSVRDTSKSSIGQLLK